MICLMFFRDSFVTQVCVFNAIWDSILKNLINLLY